MVEEVPDLQHQLNRHNQDLQEDLVVVVLPMEELALLEELV